MTSVYEKNVKQFGFSNAQKYIISQIPQNAKVLEVGSSAGYLTKVISEKGAVVDIVEINKTDFNKAKKFANKAINGSIEDIAVQKKITGRFDVIICADVLEHLVNPETVLDFLKTRLDKNGIMLISIPNVAYWAMRVHLLFKGDFKYQESGLLDKTHLRFYSLNNFKDLLSEHEYKIIEIYPAEIRVPLELSLQKLPILGSFLIKIMKGFFAKNWPNLVLHHYAVKASEKREAGRDWE